MLSTLLKLNRNPLRRFTHHTLNQSLLMIGLILTQPASNAWSEEIQFFKKGIDYWNESPSLKSQPSEEGERKKPESQPSDTRLPISPKKEFPWDTYLEPKNKEFFKEGDYTPPEPFMEIARNPSDENLKKWFQYIQLKNDLSARLQARMQEFLAKNPGTSPEVKQNTVAKLQALPIAPRDVQRYRIRMYFDSHCPHCKRMFETLIALQNKGYFVEAKQIDVQSPLLQNVAIPTEMASPQDIQSKAIQSVPLLLIGDLKKQVVYRLTGFQTVSNILNALPQGE